MRVLVLHAWMKGNLGDVLQLSVLLSELRTLNPARLDLAGYPAQAAPETSGVLALVDGYLADTFPWYWSLAPRLAGSLLFEPWWRRRRRALFSQYDAIVCAPGPYLADYDPRAISALSDITIASELGLPVVLSSHSIGPLSPAGRAGVARATLRVARELSTHRYLAEYNIDSILAADLAFVYPYAAARTEVNEPYRLVFLRSNNFHANTLRMDNGALLHGHEVVVPRGERLVLSTSDYRRDQRFLERISRTLRLPYRPCRDVQELVDLVAGSCGVVSDRYHPAICAAVLGKPATVLPNREPHKMHGLQSLLAGHSLDENQALARQGLRAVTAAIRIRA